MRLRNGGHRGVVRFVGHVDYTQGVMVGVELDDPIGKNDGSVKGKAYFKCASARGTMLLPSDLDHADGEHTALEVDDLPKNPLPTLTYLY